MSIIWTLRKYVDSIAHREEAAARQRDRDVSLMQHSGDATGEDDGPGPDTPHIIRRCRVCGLRAPETYCPTCLADTMKDDPGDDDVA